MHPTGSDGALRALLSSCARCDRLASQLGAAFKELSRSTETRYEELARMHLENVLTLLDLHRNDHAKDRRKGSLSSSGAL
jgi:hypothetical protein